MASRRSKPATDPMSTEETKEPSVDDIPAELLAEYEQLIKSVRPENWAPPPDVVDATLSIPYLVHNGRMYNPTDAIDSVAAASVAMFDQCYKRRRRGYVRLSIGTTAETTTREVHHLSLPRTDPGYPRDRELRVAARAAFDAQSFIVDVYIKPESIAEACGRPDIADFVTTEPLYLIVHKNTQDQYSAATRFISTVMSTIHKCKACPRSATRKCGRCRTTRYCSKECQTRDWPRHSEMCKPRRTGPTAVLKLE